MKPLFQGLNTIATLVKMLLDLPLEKDKLYEVRISMHRKWKSGDQENGNHNDNHTPTKNE